MRRIPGSFQKIVWSLALVLVCSCKEKSSKPAAAPAAADSTHRSGKLSADTSFSPAEIRRAGPRTADTVKQDTARSKDSVLATAAAEKPTASEAKAPLPAKPVPEPKPVLERKVPLAVEKIPVAAKPKTVPVSEAPGPEGDWVLQINIHKSEAEARAQVQKLASQGITAYAIPVPTGETGLSGDYWRVRVGRFKDRSQAQAWGEANIVSRGLKFWVDKKSNENRSAGTP